MDPTADSTTLDKQPVRKPVWATFSFVLKLLTFVVTIAGIPVAVTARNQVEPDASGASKFASAHLWLHLIHLAWAFVYFILFAGCFYNPYSLKVNVSRQRQNIKLRTRQFFILPLEILLAVTWAVMALLTGLIQAPWGIFHVACTTGFLVTCSHGIALLVLSAIAFLAAFIGAAYACHGLHKNFHKLRLLEEDVGSDAPIPA